MRVVFVVARSKFCQRQYFSNRVYQHVVLLLQLLQRLFLTYSLTTAEFVNSHLYLNIMYRCCGSDRRNNLRISVSEWLMRDYPSTFFLVYIFKCVITLCIWIMIIICVFLLCTCITVSDFIFLRTRVYHVDRRDFCYWRVCVAKILLHMSLTTRRCPCSLSDLIFCRYGDTVTFNYF